MLRTAVKVLLCALALGGGVGLAATTNLAKPAFEPSFAHAAVPAAPPPAEVEAPEPAAPLAITEARDVYGEAFKNGLVITGASKNRILLFTFDDGPNKHTTPRILDHLDAAGVRAVFFLTTSRMNGDNRREYQEREIAREIVRRGHMVASHTYDHLSLLSLEGHEVNYQLTESEKMFEIAFGERPWLLRPPGGNRSPRIDRLLAARGYTQVHWTLGAGDTQVKTPAEVAGTFWRVFERRERESGDRGGVVLLHDIYHWSVDAFPLIVEEIRRRNCELLARNEELYEIVSDPGLFFVPRGDRSPSAEAPAVELSPEALEARQAPLREETRQLCSVRAGLADPAFPEHVVR
jgi:peptidoglycan/xylan/chitin deacetylase (PgdA/CDA1 family)